MGAVELESASARPQRLQRILVALCLGLFGAGVIGLVVVPGDEPAQPTTADKELARAQAFVQRARTAHFIGEYETVMDDAENGLGSTFTDRARTSGVIEVPYRSRSVDQSGDYATETIVVEHGSYYREADDTAALPTAQWTYEPRAADLDPHAVEDTEFGDVEFLASAFDTPDLAALFRAAQNPTRVRAGVVRAEVDVSKIEAISSFYEEMDVPTPKIVIEVTSEGDGRLTRLVLEQTAKLPVFDDEYEDEPSGFSTATSKLDLTFSRWGEPIEIAAPPATDVDRTPGIAEDDLAAFTAVPLLAPRTLPAGFELLSAEVFAEETDEEVEECAEVYLEYGNGAEMDTYFADPDPDAEYPVTLDITIVPAACEFNYEIGDGTPIRLGRQNGTIVRGDAGDEEYGTTIEVVVGATRVTIESDLSEKTVVAAASDLVPFDIAAQPVHRVEPPQ